MKARWNLLGELQHDSAGGMKKLYISTKTGVNR